ncbi:uncharacterized protein LOC110460135 isoform X2 [Mizuhopecten yessoensis]|uniref:uncharacterized protein LOC110460135 isoform X2 n=1 Tax=Mizuhopecten yessoensis TaxID=6573 RepID=UPI000B45C3F4|nr:uncharacterized protein LOC110460135 isoform X2 [Mizuhopecten yessoensis]
MLTTAGNYRRRQNGSWYYDCTISSRVLFLLVLSIVIVFSATKWIPTHMNLRLGFVTILLSLLMVSGVIGSYIMGCLVRKQGIQSVVAARRNSNTPKLEVIFLWVFGLASGLYCALFVGKQIECSSGGFYWNALLWFNILLIFCLFSQLIFITYFSSFKLKQTILVNYVMLLLLTANISVILYIYLMGDTISYLINIDYEASLSSCLKDNTTMTFLRVKLRKFLDPTFVEHGLLSAAIILEIWSPTEIHYSDIGSSYTERGTTELISLPYDLTSVEHPISGNQGKMKVCHLITLAVSLTTSIGLVVCYVAMALDTEKIESISFIAVTYEFSLKLVMMIVILAGFFCLVNYCTPDSSAKGLKSREYVYLLSAFGMIMMHMFEGIVGDVSSDHSANIYMATSILSVFQDYLQVVFLMYANRCKKSDPHSNVAFLESILIFIMISNFILWFNDSFLLYEFSSTRILTNAILTKEIFPLMYQVLLPVSMYFRFTSFMEYYATFGRYTS